MTIKVLIVDDEPLAREGVALHLQAEKEFTIIGECENGSDALISKCRKSMVLT